MGRVPACVLVVLILLAPAAGANPVHEDYRRATDDHAVLRVMAGIGLRGTVAALNASLDGDHADATRGAGDMTRLATGMGKVVAVNASAATSTRLLAPLAEATRALTNETEPLVHAWARWETLRESGLRTRGDVLDARIALGLVRAHVTGADAAADTYDALDYDTTWLREALARFLAEWERADAHLREAEARLPEEEPFIHLVADVRSVTPGGVVAFHGVVVAPGAAGVDVTLHVDEDPERTVGADEEGFFQYRHPVPSHARPGTFNVTATATVAGHNLTSAPVTITITRIPTTLTLSAASTRAPGSTVAVYAELRDASGEPVTGVVHFTSGSRDGSVVSLDAMGRTVYAWNVTPLDAGARVLHARFPGSDTHAPSEAELTLPPEAFTAGDARDPSEGAGERNGPGSGHPLVSRALAALPLLIVVLALLVAHAGALELLGQRRHPLLVPSAVIGPVATAGLAHVLLGEWTWTLATLAVAAAVSGIMLRRHASHEGVDTVDTHPPERDAPRVASAIEEKLAPVADVDDADPRHHLVQRYRDLLTRLAWDGVDIRTLTHREIAREMRSRGYPADPVDAVTRMIERTLYAGAAVTRRDLAPFEAAVDALGVAS